MEELKPYIPQTKEDIEALVTSGQEREKPDSITYEPNIEKAARMAIREREPREMAALERETGRIALAASTEGYKHRRDPNDTSATGEYIKVQTSDEAFKTNPYRAGLTADAVKTLTQRTENSVGGTKPSLEEVAVQADVQARHFDEVASGIGDGTGQAYDTLYSNNK